MSMLDRYKKTGGFLQLLILVETCGPVKQAKLLETIDQEDPVWAATLRAKKLDIERVFSWSDAVFAEIIGALQDLTVAVTIMSAPEAVKTRWLTLLGHGGRKRKIEDLMQSQKPTPQEIATTYAKVIEAVRKLVHDGVIRFETFAPELCVESEIEEKLKNGTVSVVESHKTDSAVSKQTPPAHSGSERLSSIGKAPEPELNFDRAMGSDNGDLKNELKKFKQRVTDLEKENAILRHEISVARTKLEQIKKIA